ncbi:hypothetical protein [Clostridium manihotivorum]|uniref:DUF4064 domain-containing protein n=1 Tax=Clostridium manihotivorum TaxID=2320868 RepID=A0A3R5QVN7_9CLOT|nr:hypothetical protein [Clostridium manihotivorum]QAA30652.1 hypothetical protein C1I91_02650 [Clostridium manihotivorum]
MEDSRERGCLITGYLILSFIGGILSALSYPTTKLSQNLAPEIAKQFPLSNTAIIISTILGILTLIAVIGVFAWNKIAMYAFIVLAIIKNIVAFVSSGFTLGNSIWAVISIGIPALIAYTLIKRMSEEQVDENI